jgi:hypothetical protein
MIMGNVLDLRTYVVAEVKGAFDLQANHDVNIIPALERYEMSHARGRCWDILGWFFSSYEIFDKANNELIDGFTQVAMPYLAHQASVILEYKKRALECRADAGSYFKSKDLEKQIRLCFSGYKEIPSITPFGPEADLDLAFPGAEGFGVRKLVLPQPFERK